MRAFARPAGVLAWYGPRCTAYLLLIVALAVFGFRNAIAGRSPFKRTDESSRAAAAD
jgi:hypothetical protein